jgi:hypothetical protein
VAVKEVELPMQIGLLVIVVLTDGDVLTVTNLVAVDEQPAALTPVTV